MFSITLDFEYVWVFFLIISALTDVWLKYLLLKVCQSKHPFIPLDCYNFFYINAFFIDILCPEMNSNFSLFFLATGGKPLILFPWHLYHFLMQGQTCHWVPQAFASKRTKDRLGTSMKHMEHFPLTSVGFSRRPKKVSCSNDQNCHWAAIKDPIGLFCCQFGPLPYRYHPYRIKSVMYRFY